MVKTTAAPVKSTGWYFFGVSNKELWEFTDELGDLVEAGIGIPEALNILRDEMRPGLLRDTVCRLAHDVDNGCSLHESMSKHRSVFSPVYLSMIEAGEKGGGSVMDEMLKRISEYLEKSIALKRKAARAMIYPAIVVITAVAVVSGIMVFIIPKFEKIFRELGVVLPEMTRMLIKTSAWMSAYWWALPLLPLSFWTLLHVVRYSKTGRFATDRLLLWLPIIGPLQAKSIMARTTLTLGTLLRAGVYIVDALKIVRDSCGNAVYGRMYQRVLEAVKEGSPMAEPLRELGLVKGSVISRVMVGEETGKIDECLVKIAKTYDKEVNHVVESLQSLIEPIVTLALGVAVGVIVVSLFLPLVKLLETLSR